MSINLLIFYLLPLAWNLNFTQYQLVKSVEIIQPTDVSIDKTGNIYYATFNGDIIKYDPNLVQKFVFSPANPNTTTILVAGQAKTGLCRLQIYSQ